MKSLLVLFFISLISCTSWQPDVNLETSVIDYQSFEMMELELKFDGGIFPYIEIFVQNTPIKLYLDLGNHVSPFILNNNQFANIDYYRTEHKYYERNINTRFPMRKSFYEIRDIKIGDILITTSYASLNTNRRVGYLENYGYIGWPLLKEFNLYIDYSENQFILYRHGIIPSIDIQGWSRIDFNEDPILSFPINIIGEDNPFICGIDNCMVGMGEDKIYNALLFVLSNSIEKSSVSGQKYVNEVRLYDDFSIFYNDNEIKGDFLEFDIRQIKEYDLFLGGDFFFKYKVFVDNVNNTIYYLKN